MRLSERIDWNDLRLLLTVADTLQVQTTAERLNIDPTTVTRRLKRLEKQAQVKLVERIRGGVILSKECQKLITTARSLDRALDDVSTDTLKASPISGLVRLSMTDFMLNLLADDFAQLQNDNPALILDFRESYFKHSLENKEADIALRYADSPNENLVGTRHNTRCSVWGVHKYLKQQGNWPWVTLNTAHNIIDRWIDEQDPAGRIVMRCGSIISKAQFVSRGMGVAIIPDVWVNHQPELANLVKIRDGFDSQTWILTSEELRHVPKIQRCMQCIKQKLHRILG